MMNLDSRLESLKSSMTEKPLGCLSRCVLGLFNYSYHWCIGSLIHLFIYGLCLVHCRIDLKCSVNHLFRPDHDNTPHRYVECW